MASSSRSWHLSLLASCLFTCLHASGPLAADVWTPIVGPWPDNCGPSLVVATAHPTRSDLLYVASAHTSNGCGIFRSEDAGVSWRRANSGLPRIGVFPRHYPPITRIMASPSKPRIVYAGVGDLDITLYKSGDFGRSWARRSGPRVPFTLRHQLSAPVLDIAIHPMDADVVFVGALGDGLYRTVDGGRAWQKVREGGAGPTGTQYYHLVRFDATGDHLLASGFTQFAFELCLPVIWSCFAPAPAIASFGLLRSDGSLTNAAVTFELTNLDAFPTDLTAAADGSLFASTRATYVTVPIIGPVETTPNAGIRKSDLDAHDWMSTGTGSGSEDLTSAPVLGVTADPVHVGILYAPAGGRGLFTSCDSGQTWQRGPSDGLPSGAAVLATIINADGSVVLATTSGGAYRLTNPSFCSQPPTTSTTTTTTTTSTTTTTIAAGSQSATIDGRANIFGAGHTVPPAPGPSGPGILPPEVRLPAGTAHVTVSNVSGQVSSASFSFNDAEGRTGFEGTDMSSYGGISGITDTNQGRQFFLIGVFTGDAEPFDPAPPTLDFSQNESFLELAPVLNQLFFVGDGLTAYGTGTVQRFDVPTGATRLFLGFADGAGAGGAFHGLPGAYDDNSGALTATVTPCGDGVCDGPETCDECPADCICQL